MKIGRMHYFPLSYTRSTSCSHHAFYTLKSENISKALFLSLIVQYNWELWANLLISIVTAEHLSN